MPIAVEDFVRLGKALAVQDQPDHHLFAIRAVIARIAALGLGVARTAPFEVRRRQIVEVNGVVQVEQRALAGRQRLLDPRPLRMQPVEVAVQRFVAERGEVRAQDVGQRRAPDPVGHGVFGGGLHQAIQRHHFGQPLRSPTQPGVGKDRVQVQQAPHLMPHVHGPDFPFVFERHALRVDREAGVRRRRRAARGTYAGSERVDPRIRHEGPLARQRGMQPPRRAEPLVLRPRRQGAKRADDALTGALRGRDRFDEEIVLVGLVADAPGGAAEIHATGMMSLSRVYSQGKSARELVTISARRHGRPRIYGHLQRADRLNRPFCRWRPWKLG